MIVFDYVEMVGFWSVFTLIGNAPKIQWVAGFGEGGVVKPNSSSRLGGSKGSSRL